MLPLNAADGTTTILPWWKRTNVRLRIGAVVVMAILVASIATAIVMLHKNKTDPPAPMPPSKPPSVSSNMC